MLSSEEMKNDHALRYIRKQIPDFWIYLKADYMDTVIFGSTIKNFKLHLSYNVNKSMIEEVFFFLFDSNFITNDIGLYKFESSRNDHLSTGNISWNEFNIDREPELYYLISDKHLNTLEEENISQWCKNNIENNVVVSGGLIGFASENDAAFFKLTWDNVTIS